jgi:CheY-like chemotaxis protein
MNELLTILLVDDDLDDHLFFRYAIESILNGRCQVTDMYNGQQALNYLLNEGPYIGLKNPVPDLIILDINMPVMDGFSLLKILKTHYLLRDIPVVVLSTTNNIDDRRKCEVLGGNFYTKPSSIPKLRDQVKAFIDQYISKLEHR